MAGERLIAVLKDSASAQVEGTVDSRAEWGVRAPGRSSMLALIILARSVHGRRSKGTDLCGMGSPTCLDSIMLMPLNASDTS